MVLKAIWRDSSIRQVGVPTFRPKGGLSVSAWWVCLIVHGKFPSHSLGYSYLHNSSSFLVFFFLDFDNLLFPSPSVAVWLFSFRISSQDTLHSSK